MPFAFAVYAIISITKFRTHLLYTLREEEAPMHIRIGFLIVQILNMSIQIALPAIGCSKFIEDE